MTCPASLVSGGVPVDLVDEAVPGETDEGDAVFLELDEAEPLVVEPVDGILGAELVGFGVHHGEAVAVEILAGEDVVAVDGSGGLRGA